MIISVIDPLGIAAKHRIQIATIDDLEGVARIAGRPILRFTHGEASELAVLDDETLYSLLLPGPARETALQARQSGVLAPALGD